jgi:hypothetical protein
MKKHKFNEGGLPDYEREPDFDDKAQQSAAVAEYKVEKGMNPNLNADMTFKEAFAAARKEGDKTFEWRGKKYTTEMAPSKPKAPAKRRPLPGKAAEGKMSDVVGAKKGGMVKSSASKRGDGIAQRGKTRGRMV